MPKHPPINVIANVVLYDFNALISLRFILALKEIATLELTALPNKPKIAHNTNVKSALNHFEIIKPKKRYINIAGAMRNTYLKLSRLEAIDPKILSEVIKKNPTMKYIIAPEKSSIVSITKFLT